LFSAPTEGTTNRLLLKM